MRLTPGAWPSLCPKLQPPKQGEQNKFAALQISEVTVCSKRRNPFSSTVESNTVEDEPRRMSYRNKIYLLLSKGATTFDSRADLGLERPL